MNKKESFVHVARSMAEIQSILKNSPNTVPIGGGTTFYNDEHHSAFILPPHVLSFENIPELLTITKNERYIEFGALCTLESILLMGKKHIPSILYDAIYTIANAGIRSIATIGGNIAKESHTSCCYAPLIMLDAKIELRSATEVHFIPLLQYEEFKKANIAHVITRIRIYKNEWNISFYKKLYENTTHVSTTVSFMLLASAPKTTITQARVLFTGKNFLRKQEFDNFLLSHQIRMNHKERQAILNRAKEIFSREEFQSDLYYTTFFNLLDHCLYNLETQRR